MLAIRAENYLLTLVDAFFNATPRQFGQVVEDFVILATLQWSLDIILVVLDFDWVILDVLLELLDVNLELSDYNLEALDVNLELSDYILESLDMNLELSDINSVMLFVDLELFYCQIVSF